MCFVQDSCFTRNICAICNSFVISKAYYSFLFVFRALNYQLLRFYIPFLRFGRFYSFLFVSCRINRQLWCEHEEKTTACTIVLRFYLQFLRFERFYSFLFVSCRINRQLWCEHEGKQTGAFWPQKRSHVYHCSTVLYTILAFRALLFIFIRVLPHKLSTLVRARALLFIFIRVLPDKPSTLVRTRRKNRRVYHCSTVLYTILAFRALLFIFIRVLPDKPSTLVRTRRKANWSVLATTTHHGVL